MPARGIIDFKYNPEDNYVGDYDLAAKELALGYRRDKTMDALERNRKLKALEQKEDIRREVNELSSLADAGKKDDMNTRAAR